MAQAAKSIDTRAFVREAIPIERFCVHQHGGVETAGSCDP